MSREIHETVSLHRLYQMLCMSFTSYFLTYLVLFVFKSYCLCNVKYSIDDVNERIQLGAVSLICLKLKVHVRVASKKILFRNSYSWDGFHG